MEGNSKIGVELSREDEICISMFRLFKADVHFRAKRAKGFFLTLFAWRKDYVRKKFARTKKKLKEVQLFSTVISIC